MKFDPKIVEWFFIIGLIFITVIEYIILAGGLMSESPQTTLMNMSLLMIVAGELVLGILLLRIYAQMVKK